MVCGDLWAHHTCCQILGLHRLAHVFSQRTELLIKKIATDTVRAKSSMCELTVEKKKKREEEHKALLPKTYSEN
jgi:hypothetical protein